MDLTSPRRIEICGIIASGKTSLAKLLGTALLDAEVLYENFGANPFLESFYLNPEKFSFETEITFLLQHYSAIKARSEKTGLIVCDYGMILDEAFADVTLKGSQHSTFVNVHSEALKTIGQPDLIVHLKCPPEIALERIQNRNRNIEQGIPLGYLVSLDVAISSLIQRSSNSQRIVEIDSFAVNYVEDDFDKETVLQKIDEAVPKIRRQF